MVVFGLWGLGLKTINIKFPFNMVLLHHNWLTDELEKNPGSGREINPEFATDHPASHTLTHLTQPTCVCTRGFFFIA